MLQAAGIDKGIVREEKARAYTRVGHEAKMDESDLVFESLLAKQGAAGVALTKKRTGRSTHAHEHAG